MSEIRILVLGDTSTNLAHTLNRERIARAHTAHAISGTAEHIKECTVDGEELLIVIRAKDLTELDEVHCFEAGSPPDGLFLVYDVTSVHSFQSIARALEHIVSMEWEPRLPPLNLSKRRAEHRPLSHPPTYLVADTVWAVSETELELSLEDGQALAAQFGCEFCQVSSEVNEEVDRIVMRLVRQIVNR
ncbi:hypothetical protein BDV11DRAFT_199747 [Aspergillus similis]